MVGDGTTTDRHTRVRIKEDVIDVATGEFHTLAVQSDGNLWSWGGNSAGQLGIGDSSRRSTNPTRVIFTDFIEYTHQEEIVVQVEYIIPQELVALEFTITSLDIGLVGAWRLMEATGATQAELMVSPIEISYSSQTVRAWRVFRSTDGWIRKYSAGIQETAI